MPRTRRTAIRTAPRLTELSLEQLGDIEVTTVSKRPEEVWRTAVAIHVITHEDIRRSGATSIPEVLRLAPGIEVARIDSDHWSIGVRGFGDQFSKSLLVLIDGRSIYTPLFAGMYWPAHDALLDDVDRIEVIRGPGGTIWGADAVSGVINIITKAATETHGAMLAAGAGTIDRGTGALTLRRRQRTHVRLSRLRQRREPRRRTSRGRRGVRRVVDDAGRVPHRLDGPAPGNTLTVQGDVSKGASRTARQVASFCPPAQVALDGSLHAVGVNVLARWQRDFTATRGFRLQAYVDRTSWLAPHLGEQRNTIDVDFLHHATLAARHTVTAGVGARVSPSRFIQQVPTLDFTPRVQTDSVYSGFAEDEMALVPEHLWLTAGSKIEHNNYTGVEVQPGARLLWAPRPGQSAWASVSRAVRTPSRIEDAIASTSYSTTTTVPIFLRVTGNPDFDAERTVAYEAGYRARVASQVYVDLAAFHNRHRGLGSFGLGRVTIEQTPLPVHAVVDVLYVNGVSGRSDGFELSPEWQPREWWRLRGGVFLRAVRPGEHAGQHRRERGDAVRGIESAPPGAARVAAQSSGRRRIRRRVPVSQRAAGADRSRRITRRTRALAGPCLRDRGQPRRAEPPRPLARGV